jgi:hypothetical protein
VAYTLRGPFTDGTSPPLDEVTMNHFDEALDSQDDRITTIEARNLAEDAFDEVDPITDYPEGISIMPVSAGADWEGFGLGAEVVTYRTSTTGHQTIGFENAGGFAYRVRDQSVPAWTSWTFFDDFLTNSALSAHSVGADHQRIRLLSSDAFAESALATSYNSGLSIMPVSSGANWGIVDGRAGHVVNEISSSGSKQTFVAPATGESEVRYYTGGAWGAWGSTAADLAAHLADTSDAHDASAISILDSAAQYTATNAEDALAEVLDALQAHEADTTAAHAASAISYAGGTGMSATDVEAAVDELATEKANASDLTAHIDDTSDAHDATAISFAPHGSIAATTVQAAIQEVRDEAGGAGGGTGEAEINFGAFPGATDATLAVTGQASILSGSIVEAWVKPKATTEHSADEHWVEAIKVLAGNIVAGTGFTIYGATEDKTRLYGRYNVAWRWA